MVCGEALRTKLHVVDRPDLPPGSYDPQRLRGDVGEVVLAHNPRAGALHAEGLPHRQRCSQCGHAVWANSGQWACTVGASTVGMQCTCSSASVCSSASSATPSTALVSPTLLMSSPLPTLSYTTSVACKDGESVHCKVKLL